MYVFSYEAFKPELTPAELFSISTRVNEFGDTELAEELFAFAADFAEIRNLPEIHKTGLLTGW